MFQEFLGWSSQKNIRPNGSFPLKFSWVSGSHILSILLKKHTPKIINKVSGPVFVWPIPIYKKESSLYKLELQYFSTSCHISFTSSQVQKNSRHQKRRVRRQVQHPSHEWRLQRPAAGKARGIRRSREGSPRAGKWWCCRVGFTVLPGRNGERMEFEARKNGEHWWCTRQKWWFEHIWTTNIGLRGLNMGG